MRRVKQTAAMLAAAFMLMNGVVGNAGTPVVYAGVQAQAVEITKGTYKVPVSLMNAGNISNPSMAASCVVGEAMLTVAEDGTRKIEITLQTLEMMGLYGNASDIKVYSSFDQYSGSNKMDTTVVSTRTAKSGMAGNVQEVTVPEKVSITLPYTDQEGIFVTMFVDAMGMNVDAFLKIDMENAVKQAEPVKVQPTLTIGKTAATLYTSGTTSFNLTAKAVGESSKVTFKSSNTLVATVDQAGKVKAVGAGTATITASANGIAKTCKVTVKKASVSLNKTKATIYTAGTKTVQLKASTVGASGKITYTSSNKKVATVSASGKVTAHKKGTATITVTANGLKKTCVITVKNPTISVNKTKVTIKKKKTFTLKVKATPTAKVSYVSSNKKVATVSKNGVIKGVKAGKATIKVKANGITKTVKVVVK